MWRIFASSGRALPCSSMAGPARPLMGGIMSYARWWLLIACLAGMSAPAALRAQAYPVKPIRWVIPYPTGGTSDFLARLLGQQLAQAWGQSVVIDNRTGANGN